MKNQLAQKRSRISVLAIIFLNLALAAGAVVLTGCDNSSLFGSVTGPSGATVPVGVRILGNCQQNGGALEIGCVDSSSPNDLEVAWTATINGSSCHVSKAGSVGKTTNLDVTVCGFGVYTVVHELFSGENSVGRDEYSVPVTAR